MIKTTVIGGTGYTGCELVRLLIHHPRTTIEQIISRSEAGKAVNDVFPNLPSTDLQYSEHFDLSSKPDIVFFATPNGIAMKQAQALLDSGLRVIDLAADFRLNADDWHQWYGEKHTCPQLLEQAVYGLPELYRTQIANAQLVANPGCYPTSVILGLKPLIESGIVDVSCLIADSKSGVSGAGRRANVGLLFGECSENFKAYKVSAHRHWPEIKTQLDRLAGSQVGLTFTPHLLPITRGIHSTLYVKTAAEQSELQSCLVRAYSQEPFVKVLPAGSHPQTRQVAGTNDCILAVHKPQHGDIAVVLSVLDNLVKGAAGQAIQNMNLMFGLDETAGLDDLLCLG